MGMEHLHTYLVWQVIIPHCTSAYCIASLLPQHPGSKSDGWLHMPQALKMLLSLQPHGAHVYGQLIFLPGSQSLFPGCGLTSPAWKCLLFTLRKMQLGRPSSKSLLKIRRL